MEAFNAARPIIAARGVGLAQGAIDHAIEFVQDRRDFGQTVSDFQGVRWMLADMAMQTEAARNLVYRAASMVDAGVTGKRAGADRGDGQVLRDRRRDEGRDRRGAALRRLRRVRRSSRSTATCATPRCCRSSRAPTRSSATSSATRCSDGRSRATARPTATNGEWGGHGNRRAWAFISKTCRSAGSSAPSAARSPRPTSSTSSAAPGMIEVLFTDLEFQKSAVRHQGPRRAGHAGLHLRGGAARAGDHAAHRLRVPAAWS